MYVILILLMFVNCSQNYLVRNVIDFNTKKSINGGDELIYFTNLKSKELFDNAKYKDDFFRLAPFFEPQKYPSTCGPASLRMILAALYHQESRKFLEAKDRSRVGKIHGVEQKYYAMTEENIFDFMNKIPKKEILDNNDYTDYDIIARKKKNSAGKYNGGTGAEHLIQIAKTHGFNGEFFSLSNKNINLEENIKLFKRRLIDTLQDKNSYMIGYIAQIGSKEATSPTGHFVPIASYNLEKDMILILDTYINSNNWYWIKIEDFVKSMIEEYNKSFSRGYLIIKNN